MRTTIFLLPPLDYPALTKPVRKPLGEFTRLEPDGWQFTHHFKYVRVCVDLEQRTRRLEWNPAPRTSQPFRT